MQIGAEPIHHAARDYTPATGQFTSADPLGLGGLDTNLRRYVANNPVNGVDPEGLQWWKPILKAIGLNVDANAQAVNVNASKSGTQTVPEQKERYSEWTSTTPNGQPRLVLTEVEAGPGGGMEIRPDGTIIVKQNTKAKFTPAVLHHQHRSTGPGSSTTTDLSGGGYVDLGIGTGGVGKTIPQVEKKPKVPKKKLKGDLSYNDEASDPNALSAPPASARRTSSSRPAPGLTPSTSRTTAAPPPRTSPSPSSSIRTSTGPRSSSARSASARSTSPSPPG